MRIDYVRMPELNNKTPAEALRLLYEHCRETADHVMRAEVGKGSLE